MNGNNDSFNKGEFYSVNIGVAEYTQCDSFDPVFGGEVQSNDGVTQQKVHSFFMGQLAFLDCSIKKKLSIRHKKSCLQLLYIRATSSIYKNTLSKEVEMIWWKLKAGFKGPNIKNLSVEG